MDTPDPRRPSQSPHDAPPTQALNVQALLDRCMGRADLAGTLLNKLQKQAAEDLECLSAMIAAGDLAAGSRRAHALKGAAAALAAAQVQAGAARLEQACRDAAASDAVDALAALRSNVESLFTDLPLIKARLASPNTGPDATPGARP